ncbi:MAG: SidA/IucD/PvdA family monooxygenase [Limimaricola sp.]|nr:SidA/IucD/PvdA family monooxygenase [Limimaricola sp.]
MHDCVVIGAGPGGLVATKELVEAGIADVLCLEASDRIGGLFAKGYDNLLLTSSAVFSMFSDFWIGPGPLHRFWTKAEVVEYWTRYAAAFGVLELIRFGARVEALRQAADGTWQVQLAGGEVVRAARVVLASGANNAPRYPDWAAGLTAIDAVHAADYRNAAALEGKRVLLVGGGESAADIGLEISRVAGRTWLSLRGATGWVTPRMRGEIAADTATHRGVWGLPRSLGPWISQRVLAFEAARDDPVSQATVMLNRLVSARGGIWGTYGTKSLGLSTAIAHHGMEVVDEIVTVGQGGRQLTTASGAVLDDVDAVVFCTGYTSRVPFLPEGLRARSPRSLYKQVFDPGTGATLAFVGWARPCFGSQFPIMEMQARLVARVFGGAQALPPPDEMTRVAARDAARFGAQLGHHGERVQSLVDYHLYVDDIARLIGCLPPFGRLLTRHPRLWLRVVYGPTQATQFRLRGPGAKPSLAREIIARLPVSPFNHMVKAGLLGRLRVALGQVVPRRVRPVQVGAPALQRKGGG